MSFKFSLRKTPRFFRRYRDSLLYGVTGAIAIGEVIHKGRADTAVAFMPLAREALRSLSWFTRPLYKPRDEENPMATREETEAAYTSLIGVAAAIPALLLNQQLMTKSLTPATLTLDAATVMAPLVITKLSPVPSFKKVASTYYRIWNYVSVDHDIDKRPKFGGIRRFFKRLTFPGFVPDVAPVPIAPEDGVRPSRRYRSLVLKA
jgi:hypothetical protein